jgi:fluoride exporter
MTAFVLVALGGGLGAAGRYAVGLWVNATWPGLGFPLATLIVNGAGGLAMGLLMAQADHVDRALLLTLGVGFLGGFTTFSAFRWRLLRCLNAATSL